MWTATGRLARGKSGSIYVTSFQDGTLVCRVRGPFAAISERHDGGSAVFLGMDGTGRDVTGHSRLHSNFWRGTLAMAGGRERGHGGSAGAAQIFQSGGARSPLTQGRPAMNIANWVAPRIRMSIAGAL